VTEERRALCAAGIAGPGNRSWSAEIDAPHGTDSRPDVQSGAVAAIAGVVDVVDERVRELLAAGDTSAAVEVAMRGVGPSVFQYLRAMLRDEVEAADAFSAFAETLLRGLPQFRGESSLRTWALRLAINEAFDIQRQPWRRRVRRLASREASELADRVRASSELHHEQRRRDLERLRRKLSPQDQSLLTLRIDQGLSWDEISTVLAGSGEPVSAATLAKRLERTTDRLKMLARRDGLLD
jgi:RNA polymerase sigma-70 factor (ECF subfamily)